MGHKISKEQIDPGVKDHIMSFVGDVNELETDEKSNIIDAVNSLIVDRVDNVENMGKLANAIGEPITANHSVNEVVEGLGEMLSTFKTNMMNNGVVVESGDKFKQLIDKLTILSDSEGSGIQFSTGFINKTSLAGESNTNWVRNPMTFDTPLPFTPTRVIVSLPDVGMNTDISGNYYIGNISVDSLLCFDDNVSDELSMYDVHGDRVYLYITNITNDGFDLYAQKTSSNNPLGTPRGIYWCAIGVGEEDTTLRDSLANILGDKGVEVSPDDDMASLITKVDSISSGLDIISATELPSNGRENQICVITDNPTDKFLVSSLDSDFSNLPNDTILLQTRYESTTHNYTVNNGNIISKYYISSCAQEDSIIPSYVYTSGQWVELTPGRLYFVKNKQIVTNTEFGDIHRVSPPYVQVTSDGIHFYSSETTRGTCVTMTNKTNLSAFRNIHIVAKVSSGGSSSKSIGVYSSSTTQNRSLGTSGSYPTGYVKVSTQTFTSKDYADGNVSFYRQEFDFNITDWTGEYYLGFYFYCYDTNSTRSMYIEEIYFY